MTEEQVKVMYIKAVLDYFVAIKHTVMGQEPDEILNRGCLSH